VLREVAGMAEKSGLRVAIYPHTGCYVARIDEALRLVKRTDRKNVGMFFNLCHYLKNEDAKDLKARLREAMPHVFDLCINGTDGGETNKMNWDRLIQTLDRGTFDVYDVVKTAKELGYTGQVSLQCYAIRGDTRDILRRSMGAWRKFSDRLASEEQKP
jgi:sugar phosphate isomerase/epimerase